MSEALLLTTIKSGGQTGADRAFLETARELGYATGGYAPRDFMTENGPDPSLREFGLVEIDSRNYAVRTRLNVIDGDLTVWFGNVGTPGFFCTKQNAVSLRKPFVVNPTAEELRRFLRVFHVRTLNGSGNRASRNPDVFDLVCRTLKEALPAKCHDSERSSFRTLDR